MFKKLLSTNLNIQYTNIALLLLRLALGVLMAKHGYSKLAEYSEIKADFYDFLGMGMEFSLVLTIFSELFCSILLAWGLLTRLTLIPLIITMIVAVFDIHKGEIFGDGQTAFLFLVGYVALFLTGPGHFSADRFLFKK